MFMIELSQHIAFQIRTFSTNYEYNTNRLVVDMTSDGSEQSRTESRTSQKK